MRSRSLATSTLFLSTRKLTSRAVVRGAITRNAARTPIDTGKAIRNASMIRSWLLPGSAQICRGVRRMAMAADMREQVDFRQAGQIEFGAPGQEIETGLSQRGPPLARQPAIELLAQSVEVTHVRRGIILLRVGQDRAAPVGQLLGLGDILAEQFADQFLQPMSVGIGADQPR